MQGIFLLSLTTKNKKSLVVFFATFEAFVIFFVNLFCCLPGMFLVQNITVLALMDETVNRSSATVISVEQFFELSSAAKSFEPIVILSEKQKASLRVCGGRPSKALDCTPWPQVREHSYTLYRKNARSGEDHNECRIFAHGIETVYERRKTSAVAYC